MKQHSNASAAMTPTLVYIIKKMEEVAQKAPEDRPQSTEGETGRIVDFGFDERLRGKQPPG